MEGFITVKEAAERSGYDDSSIRRLIKAGKLQATTIGTAYAIDAASFEVWLPTATIIPKGWVTMKWAAAKSGIAETTLRKMGKNGKLAEIRNGSRVYVEMAAVEAIATNYDATEARRENGRKRAAAKEGVKRQERTAVTLSDDPPCRITERMMGALQMKARVMDIARWY